MTLLLAVVIYGALLYLGYRIARWATKPWYPRYMGLMLAVSMCGAIGAFAAIGLWYEANHLNVGVPD